MFLELKDPLYTILQCLALEASLHPFFTAVDTTILIG